MSTRKKKIKLSCHCYCIYNKDKPERLEEIKDTLKRIDCKSKVIVDANERKTGSHSTDIAQSHINALDKAIEANAFPLLLLEDDAALNVDHFNDIKIPPAGCFIIYLGSSLLDREPFESLSIENYSREYFRIYRGASTHAIYIPSIENGEMLKKIYKHTLKTNIGIDGVLASIYSNKLVMLTPKDGPYFYQTSPQHAFDETHFLWKDHLHLTRKKGTLI